MKRCISQIRLMTATRHKGRVMARPWLEPNRRTGPLTNAQQKVSNVNWLKRYAFSCLIALFVFSGLDTYRHQDDMHIGTVVVVSAVWPAFVAIVFGSCAGDALRAMTKHS